MSSVTIDVHAQVTLGEGRDPMAVAHPERNVIEGLRLHPSTLANGVQATAAGFRTRMERNPAVA